MVFKRNRVASTLTDTELGYLDGVTAGTSIASKAVVLDSGGDFILIDDHTLKFGTGSDVTLNWDGTDFDVLAAANNSIIKWGTGTNSFDQWWFGSSASLYFSFDASANDLKFEDSVSLMFGTGSAAGPGAAGDVEIRWDGTDLDVLPAADDSVIKFGNGTLSFDIWIYGNAAGDTAKFDASLNLFEFNGVDIALDDSDLLFFGDSADVSIRWDATDLDILGLADDQVIKFGNGTNSFDVWVYGNTASDYVWWDASASTLAIVGAAQLNLTGSFRTVVAKTGDYSVLLADSGKVFTTLGALGTVIFTLPAVATSAGMDVTFCNAVGQTMTITAPAGTLVCFNNATATSASFAQASELIGATARAVCDGAFWYLIPGISEAVTMTVS